MSQEVRSSLIHTCDIQRPDIQVDTGTTRDRRIAKYDDVSTSVPCWFEPTGTEYNFNEQLGQIAIKSFNIHFLSGQDIKAGDRLKKSTTYYLVQDVTDNTDQEFHIVAVVVQKEYAAGQ